jgi:hypothetical protein
MQNEADAPAAPAAAPKSWSGAAAKRSSKLLGKAGNAFGSLFKAAEKPAAPQIMEMQEWRPAGHRKIGSDSSTITLGSDTASDQAL